MIHFGLNVGDETKKICFVTKDESAVDYSRITVQEIYLCFKNLNDQVGLKQCFLRQCSKPLKHISQSVLIITFAISKSSRNCRIMPYITIIVQDFWLIGVHYSYLGRAEKFSALALTEALFFSLFFDCSSELVIIIRIPILRLLSNLYVFHRFPLSFIRKKNFAERKTTIHTRT